MTVLCWLTRVRNCWFIIVLALIGLIGLYPSGLASVHALGSRGRADVMPLSAIRPGMKGYGLTVFDGTKPERFDVEVIDVLKGFLPKQDLILIKTRHPRLDVTRVVAGMSGSPIFLQGKMIGAYAYGWTFARESVAGVTPIENMLSDLDRPVPAEIYGWRLGMTRGLPKSRRVQSKAETADYGHRYVGDLEHYALMEHARQIAKASSIVSKGNGLRPVDTPLLIGGMTPLAMDIAHRLLAPLGFDPMQSGGGSGTDPSAPTRYVDGSAIGVQLIRGDTSAMGLGTVTRVEGNRLVAFGHPMMQAGTTSLPTSVGKVVWFLASEMRSFKLGMPVRSLGALVGDRQASIVVDQAANAPIVAVRLDIEGIDGEPLTTWRFEIAHEKFLSPSFLAMALGSAIQSSTAEKRDISWTLDSRVRVQGLPDLKLVDFGVAVGGMPTADDVLGWSVVGSVGALLNNPWQPVVVKEVVARLRIKYAREIYRLRGVELLDTEIDAGQPARVRLTLVPYDGPTQTRVLSVPIPENLAGESVTLDIVPGYTEEREMAPAETLMELVHNLNQAPFPPQSVIVKFTSEGKTLAYRGRVASHLPPGIADALSSTSGSLSPTAFVDAKRTIFKLPYYVVGKERVTVDVRPVLR